MSTSLVTIAMRMITSVLMLPATIYSSIKLRSPSARNVLEEKCIDESREIFEDYLSEFAADRSHTVEKFMEKMSTSGYTNEKLIELYAQDELTRFVDTLLLIKKIEGFESDPEKSTEDFMSELDSSGYTLERVNALLSEPRMYDLLGLMQDRVHTQQ